MATPSADRPLLRQLEPTLPSAWYYDAAHHRRELDVFWSHHWLYACRAEEIARPRDFVVVDVGDQSVVLTRTQQGEIRAFHNSCRHRGSLLCSEARGRFVGASIICPYHGWTYSLDGALLGAKHQLPTDDFRKEDFPLHAVAVGEWAGHVFVHLDPDSAAPLEDALGQARIDLAPWPLADLVIGHRETQTVACNWKVFWENFSECFHCPGIHPELSAIVPLYAKSFQDPLDDPDLDPREPAPPGLVPGAVTWTLDGGAVGPELPGLSQEDRLRGQTYGVLWPGFFVVGHVDYARAVRVLPRGPEQIELDVVWLFPPETLAAADFDLERAIALGARVVEQDARVCEVHQRGLRSRAFDQGVLVPQEYEVHAFQNWIRAGLAASDR